jgi:hypothetical protein
MNWEDGFVLGLFGGIPLGMLLFYVLSHLSVGWVP